MVTIKHYTMKTTYNFIYKFLLVILIATQASCVVDSNSESIIDSKLTNKIQVNLKVPTTKNITRSLSEEDTYKVDLNTLKVFLFKDNLFVEDCKVNIERSTQGDSFKEYNLTIHVPEQTMIADLVFFANTNVITPNYGDSKKEYCEDLVMNVDGIWDTDKKDNLIPMWGELKSVHLNNPIKNQTGASGLNVSLLRALARIDIISNSTEASSFPFKIIEAHIYKSQNQLALVPAPNNYDAVQNLVTHPTVPTTSVFSNPAVIELIKDQIIIGENGVALVPEQIAKKDGQNLSVVLKLNIDNKVDKFYRVNLHKKNNDKYEDIDILRNHRYIINVTKVIGLGFDTAEEAAKNPSSNIDAQVIQWDENINNGFISGSLYFGINTADIEFKPSDNKDITAEIAFQTNLSEEQMGLLAKSISWHNNTNQFSAKLDYKNSKIIISPNGPNTTNKVIEDEIMIKRDKSTFKVKISQNFIQPAYQIICEETKVAGLYQIGRSLTDANTITIKTVSDKDLTGYSYDIHTEVLDNMSFYGKGDFVSKSNGMGKFESVITLHGQGIPTDKQIKYFTIKANSSLPTSCVAKIKMAYSPKFIVALEKENNNGSTFNESTNGRDPLSAQFRKSERNFGLSDEAIVKIKPLKELTGREGEAYIRNNGGFLQDYAQKSSLDEILTGRTYGYVPDIVIIGGTYKNYKTTTRRIVEYLEKGGCLFYMQGATSSIKKLFQSLYENDDDIKHKYIRSAQNASGKASTTYQLINHVSDPIYNGPFGNLNGVYWKDDKGSTDAILGLPEQDIIVYSDNVPAGEEMDWGNRGVTMFRHIEHNLVCISYDDFVSNTSTTPGSSSNSPYQLDKNLLPVKSVLNSRPGGTVHNAVIAANILAYLIDQAEYDGINSWD